MPEREDITKPARSRQQRFCLDQIAKAKRPRDVRMVLMAAATLKPHPSVAPGLFDMAEIQQAADRRLEQLTATTRARA